MTLALRIGTILDRAAIATIEGYQTHLSPRKGFVCAHRVRHGGDSCSQYIKGLIASDGLRAGLRALGPRFRDCHTSSAILRVQVRATDQEREFDEYFDSPGTDVGWPAGVESHPPDAPSKETSGEECLPDTPGGVLLACGGCLAQGCLSSLGHAITEGIFHSGCGH